MTDKQKRAGFTLVEVMIVVVLIAILAAVILPYFGDSTKDAKTSTAKFNVRMLREQLQLYRNHHDGNMPATLDLLLTKSNSAGVVGTTAAFPYGPYVMAIPDNPMTGSSTVRTASTNPPAAASGAADAGWLYHAASGGIWLDDAELLSE